MGGGGLALYDETQIAKTAGLFIRFTFKSGYIIRVFRKVLFSEVVFQCFEVK